MLVMQSYFVNNVIKCFFESCSCLCLCIFVGTERHELTSWMSFNSIFRFFSEVLEGKEDEEAEETSNIVTTRSSSFKSKHQDL